MTQITVAAEAVTSFIDALDDQGYSIDESEMSTTDTMIDEFTAKWGAPHDDVKANDGVTIFIWHELQVAKGKRRGCLCVSAVEGGSVSYFSGES